jgi:alpha-galactosidase
MKKNLCYFTLTLVSLFLKFTAFSQKQISIETDNTTFILTVGKDGKLYQSYLGDRLTDLSKKQMLNKHEAVSYIAAGMDDLFEPAIRIVHSDGNPSLDLKFVAYKVNASDDSVNTIITLKDNVYPVTVILHFTSFLKENVIKEWVDISHKEAKPIRLTNFASSMLHFKADRYWLTQFHGDWAEEMRMQESALTSGIKIMDSKLGTRADMYQSPVFILSLDNKSTEDAGKLIMGTLAWTGNFQFLFQVDPKNQLRVISGMNPYGSDYLLDSGIIFTTPAFIFTYSNQGRGVASRDLHNWARNFGVLNGRGSRMTLLNNWEATKFNFDESKLVGLFGEAAKLGVDLFLLDDGWFGNKYPRHNDKAGLGDWQADKEILPSGISNLVKQANRKGVKFGIWVEPEMVNPKSELYEKHPNWILKLPNRKEDYYRNQLVLDLVNPDVQQFVYNVVDNLLTENPGISYIKWDCNRMMTNTYSPYLKERQSNLFIDYVHGLYSVLGRLRKKYPKLPMMLCSGGGGRTDYGALKYFTEFWPSDNTDALERIFIQWGYSYFFPSLTLSAHITSWGKESLKFRTDVAMMGRLGYDIDVAKMPDKDIAFSQDAVKNYKRISPVIWQGDLYRLISPYHNERSALMYVDTTKTKAILFAFTLHPRYGENWTPIKLEGLIGRKVYEIHELNLYPGIKSSIKENGKQFTGEYLMKEGLIVSGKTELSSVVIEITETGQ